MTRIFRMKELVTGLKKERQDAHPVFDKEGNLVFSNEEIRSVSLEHCLKTFENQTPHKDAEQIVKIKEWAHGERMKDRSSWDLKIDEDDVMLEIQKFKRKNKKSYHFITKAGDSFQEAICRLAQELLVREEFPVRFQKTLLTQLWKKKGSIQDLNNHRYIHTKDWLPKLCESVVVRVG